MRIKHTDPQFVSVVDDNDNVLEWFCPYNRATAFEYNGDIYVVLGPYFKRSDDWVLYKLTKVE